MHLYKDTLLTHTILELADYGRAPRNAPHKTLKGQMLEVIRKKIMPMFLGFLFMFHVVLSG